MKAFLFKKTLAIAALAAMILYMLNISSQTSRKSILFEERQQMLKGLAHDDDISILNELFAAIRSERLSAIAKKYKKEYGQNLPFPHIAVDGIFPERFLKLVLEENPESLVQSDSGCVDLKGEPCFRGSQTESKKSAIEHEDSMGPYTKILFGAMKSSNFIAFLEELSGISNIIPDPHYRGSGLHFTTSGGNLDIHADFNKYQQFGLDRRVNAFIFLNPDWPDEYGGHLELWSRDMQSCSQKIRPALGRFVVFSSTDFSYHGHPQPLAAPAGRVRRSMALYYYTNGRPRDECLDNDCSGEGHSTLFQKPVGCERCEEQSCRKFDDNAVIQNWTATTKAR
ncbi:hypothetical protein ACA910_007272 [Epithemia clementina (nom. ined.)]